MRIQSMVLMVLTISSLSITSYAQQVVSKPVKQKTTITAKKVSVKPVAKKVVAKPKVSAISVLAEKLGAMDQRLKQAEEKINTLENQVQAPPIVEFKTDEELGISNPQVVKSEAEVVPVSGDVDSISAVTESNEPVIPLPVKPEDKTSIRPIVVPAVEEKPVTNDVSLVEPVKSTSLTSPNLVQSGKPAVFRSIDVDHVAFEQDGKVFRCDTSCPDLASFDKAANVKFYPKKSLVEFQTAGVQRSCAIKTCAQTN